MKKWTWLLLLSSLYHTATCQATYIDTLINKRNTNLLDGRIITVYTPGNIKKAIELQKVFENAVTYYEKRFSVKFSLKLAVLDSTQWLNELVPYGFVFYDSSWAVLNTGMNLTDFLKISGSENSLPQIQKELTKLNITAEEFISSYYKFTAIHELGHYFIDQLLKIKSPDNWANELVATFFSYNYFAKNDAKVIAQIDPYNLFVKDHFNPKYRSIKDFDSLYFGMGIPNFRWYHCNINLLASKIYKQKGSKFLNYYIKVFTKSVQPNSNPETIAIILDNFCEGIVSIWLNDLELKKH